MLLPKTFLPFLILTNCLMLCLQASQSASAQQLELVVPTGHTGRISSIIFSPDGKLLASAGSYDETITLWDVMAGQILRSISVKEWVETIAFSPDGKLLAGGTHGSKVKIWDVESGKELRTLIVSKFPSNSCVPVAFSPNGKMLATGTDTFSIKLWDVASGTALKTLEGHTSFVISLAFSPNGAILASGSYNTTKRWDVSSGKELNSFDGFPASFSPDGKVMGINIYKKNVLSDGSVWFSDEGRFEFRDVATGQVLDSLIIPKTDIYGISRYAVSPNAYVMASREYNNPIKLWNIASGQEFNKLAINSLYVDSLTFSPNGKILASAESKNTIRLWDATTGEELKTLKSHTPSIYTLAFSPDGKTLASGSGNVDYIIKLWDFEPDTKVKTLRGHAFSILALAFSPDGKTLASSSIGEGYKGIYDIRLWDVASGKELKTLIGHNTSVHKLAVSSDGKTLVSQDADKIIKLWDTLTGKLLDSFSLDSPAAEAKVKSKIPDFDFSYPNTYQKPTTAGEYKIAAGENGRLDLYKVGTKIPLVSLIALDEEDWVVIDSEGRFDASEGALKLMHYTYGLQTVDLEQFKDEYFEPGLLQKIFKGEQLRAVVPLKDAKLPPEVVSQMIEPKTTKLTIKLKNRGGGFGAIRVFVNDKLAVADARDAKLKANPNTTQEFVDLTVNLNTSAFVKGKICEDKLKPETCRDNKITVYTSNYLAAYQTSNITSRGTEIFWLAGEDDASNFKLPTLYAIVGGVSDYTGNALDLKFAAKDAEDFSNALRFGAQRLFCDKDKPDCLDKVNITTLSTSGNKATIAPTKENFRKAFADVAAKAQPEDIVLIYLSGHGVSLDDTDTYFYLTQDAASPDKNDLTKNYRTVSITSNELLCWLTTTPCQEKEQQLEFEGKPQLGTKALRQVIILDTCAAGKAGQTLALIAQKDLSTDQRRAIEFLKDKSGTHILMGSTADQPSYEASKFGQGLLTRALLEGMSGAALEKVNGFVDVQTLFRYAENRVEKLAVNIGGIQRPTNAAPAGKTFAIGQMMPPAQKQIAEKLPKEKPYIIRPSFGNREDNFDNLGLNNALAKLLNDQNNPLMTKGGEAVLVYLNEENFAGAIKPTGFYTLADGIVTVKVSLYRDGQRIAEPFEVGGNEKEIVEKLLAAIRAELEKIAK